MDWIRSGSRRVGSIGERKMSRQEYMNKLNESLKEFEDGVRQEIVEAYDELFVTGAMAGKTEEQVIEELGSIEELVNDLNELSGKGINEDKDIKGKTERNIEEMAEDFVKNIANFIGSLAGSITKGAEKVTGEVVDGVGNFAENFASNFDSTAEKVVSKSQEFAKEFMNSYKAATVEDTEEDIAAKEKEVAEAPKSADFSECSVADIQTDCGDITIKVSEYNNFHVDYENNGTLNQQLAYKFDFKQDGNVVTVTAKKQPGNANFFKNLSSPEIKLTVFVPQWMEAVTASSLSGDIEVEGINADSVNLNTMSGDIVVNACHMKDELVCSSMSGDVVANDDVVGRIQAKSMSGDIRFVGMASAVTASSTSGDVRAEAKNAARVNASSVSGDVKVILPEAAGFTASVKSVSGDLSLKFYDEKKNDAKNGDYVFGDGSVVVAASSVSGDVCVKA